MQASKHQEAIYEFMVSSEANLMIEAVAGSGKTTTIVEIARRLKDLRILFLAFNKHIATELKDRVPSNCDASTMHALGYRVCKERFGWMKVNANKTWNMLSYTILPDDKRSRYWGNAISKLISLAKGHMISPTDLRIGYMDLADHFDINIPKMKDSSDVADFGDALQNTYIACNKQTKVIDFDDQIYYPILYDLSYPKYDLVLVDESQDMNVIRAEVLKRLDARIVCVGDRHQAIYGFQGADEKAMDNIKESLSASELPLSICYRCGDEIVKEAQKIVPHIQPSGCRQGSVSDITVDEFRAWAEDDDFVLCRCTAPLVEECMEFIRKNRKATVKGKDIGKDLITLVEGIQESSSLPNIEGFLVAMEGYFGNLRNRYDGKENKLATLDDQQATIEVLAEGCQNHGEIIRRIETIFSDEASGITFCTVHRAKGLEADRIFILRPDLMPHPRVKIPWMVAQEENLRYVAITRAKNNLYYINP